MTCRPCFVNVIEEVALEAGQDLELLLPRLDVIRYSTTVAMNRLIERRGPRVGLITTEGHEDAISSAAAPSGPTGRARPSAATSPCSANRTAYPWTMIVGVKEKRPTGAAGSSARWTKMMTCGASSAC